MIVRNTENQDLARCKEIWKKSFPQDIKFADRFFYEIHQNDCSFICEKDNVIAGYLSAMPFSADINGNTVDCRYYYGICVDPSFRGQGVMRYMLNSVMDIYKCFSILIPAVSGLYEKFGFKKFTEASETVINNPTGKGMLCDDISHLNGIYNEYRKGFDASIVRNELWWKTIFTEANREGFSVIANDGAYAFVKGSRIIELAYISESYKNSLPIGDAVLHLPVSMYRGAECDGKNYLALMLD